MIDWINELEEYFEYEEIEDSDKVKFAKAKLKVTRRFGGRKSSWIEIVEERTKSLNGRGL